MGPRFRTRYIHEFVGRRERNHIAVIGPASEFHRLSSIPDQETVGVYEISVTRRGNDLAEHHELVLPWVRPLNLALEVSAELGDPGRSQSFPRDGGEASNLGFINARIVYPSYNQDLF
jgi:hypothetical protein